MSRISLTEGKTAGQKVHRKIAGVVLTINAPLILKMRDIIASPVSLSPRTREQLQPAGPASQLSTPPPPPPVWAGAQLSLVVAAGVTAFFCCWCLPRGKYLQHNEACLSLRYSTEKCAQGIPGLKF